MTRVAGQGQDEDPAGQPGHLQLTTLGGWRGFVTELPSVPDLLPDPVWTSLEEGKRACYDGRPRRSPLPAAGGPDPATRQVIISSCRLIQLNKNACYGRCCLMVSGPARPARPPR